MNPKNAWSRTLDILAHRAQSEARLKKKLVLLGVAHEEAEEAAIKARRLKLLDDASYARMLAERELRLGRGPLRIRAALLAHGISDPQIREALSALDLDQSEQVLN